MSEDVPLLPSRHGRKTSSSSSSSSSASSSASAPNDSVPAPQLLTNFDQALSHLGTYGPWQIVVVGLLWLPAVAAGVIVLLWSFTGLEPKYIYLNFRETIREIATSLMFEFSKRAFRCALKECDCEGSSSFSDANLNAYFSDNNNGHDPDFCLRPVLNGSIPDAWCPDDPLLRENCSYLDESHIVGYKPCDVRSGDRVLYAPFEYESTLVTELNLVLIQSLSHHIRSVADCSNSFFPRSVATSTRSPWSAPCTWLASSSDPSSAATRRTG